MSEVDLSNEVDPSKMSEEDLKAFMSGHPTRDEVNRYLNNVYMSINNAFGAMQGNSIASLAATVVSTMQEAGLKVELETFMKKFADESIKNIEQIQKKMSESAQQISEEQASQPEDAKEVDVSMF